MKLSFLSAFFFISVLLSSTVSAQTTSTGKINVPAGNLYMDVHHVGAGKVNFDDVVKAHAKDLGVENKFGVHFLKFWVDEEGGNVYCLATARDTQSLRKTHALAHGMLADDIYLVKRGQESIVNGPTDFFLDFHHFGAGKVTAADVEGAHQKDLATQSKYGVNFINYYVNEKSGLVVCLSQAKDSSSIVQTHKEAHGLLPAEVIKVKQGE